VRVAGRYMKAALLFFAKFFLEAHFA